MIICPECDVHFTVIWNNDGFSKLEFCPMCGAEIDLEECEDDGVEIQ